MKFTKGIRKFNKRFLNRLTGRIARSSWGPFCMIYHTGRRSGTQYETPIIAIPTGADFVVALTYGPEVDWFRNICAAGHAKILWRHREYEIGQIEPMEPHAALSHFSFFERAILRLIGTDHFVRLVGNPQR